MNEKELLEFVSQIISSGNEENIKLSLMELSAILNREDVDEQLKKCVNELALYSREAAELGGKKEGRPVNMQELAVAISNGRERLKRESTAR